MKIFHTCAASDSGGMVIFMIQRLNNATFQAKTLKPLDTVWVSVFSPLNFGEKIQVLDGEGKIYCESYIDFELLIGGALGKHIVQIVDSSGTIIESSWLKVNCETGIEGNQHYQHLLSMLHFTMASEFGKSFVLNDDKVYSYFVCWCRDHVHTLKGMKYYDSDLKSGMDIYKDNQKDNGMIWDNIYPITDTIDYFKQIFGDEFSEISRQGKHQFRRIPVEADVEYLYVEGIYYTWKATGDTSWMISMLDSAKNALSYCRTNKLRWSEKYQLIKRGFTIDTWDFQSYIDAKRLGHPMLIDEKSNFGIMHGDNTGYIASLNYLAEMLDYAGQELSAKEHRSIAKEMQKRLEEVSWNGNFFTHHVPEENIDRSGLGVELDTQVSLSNTYALNRGIDKEQQERIISTYMKIRDQLPEGSTGEWFTIYPTFETFNGIHSEKWEYMNGGVITIAAGELARGAFLNGFEDYGVDILKRIGMLADENKGFLPCTFKGYVPPERSPSVFNQMDISDFTNVRCDLTPEGGGSGEINGQAVLELPGVPVGRFDFEGIPFKIPEPCGEVQNCVGLSTISGYKSQFKLDIGCEFKSLYLLQAMTGGKCSGTLTFEYEDGTIHSDYIYHGVQNMNWYMPAASKWADSGGKPFLKVAWQGKNSVCNRTGLCVFACNNPHPEKMVKSLIFDRAVDQTCWYVFGITLSDSPAWLDMGKVSFGIPACWGAAACTYALVEGLAGVVDKTVGFEKVEISPRWTSANVEDVTFTVKYPASGGYLKYSYKQKVNGIELIATGNSQDRQYKIMVPNKLKVIHQVLLNDKSISYEIQTIKESRYVVFDSKCISIDKIFIQTTN